MLRWAALLSGTILLTGCSVFGIRSGTEQPAYQVVAELGEAVEVRRYGPRLAAEVEVEAGDEVEARNAACRILANYIFGDNRAREEIAMTAPVEIAKESEGETIAMTAPVETARGDGRLTMRFFLPAAFTEANVPRPTDPRVRILTVPGETLAVRRFTGWHGPDDVEAEEARLRATLDGAALDGAAWRPAGEAVAFFYDPPWTIPFLRRNEVALPVVDG